MSLNDRTDHLDEPRFCDGCEDFTTDLDEVDDLLLCAWCR